MEQNIYIGGDNKQMLDQIMNGRDPTDTDSEYYQNGIMIKKVKLPKLIDLKCRSFIFVILSMI